MSPPARPSPLLTARVAVGELKRLLVTRERSRGIVRGVEPEDACIQTMPDVSPSKWHLAHTTWFLETFVLPRGGDAAVYDASFGYLFNSYYETAGARHPRPERGLASRPTLAQVIDYRSAIDARLIDLARRIETNGAGVRGEQLSNEDLAGLVMGLRLAHHHEEQHQELMLTDLRHVLGTQPLRPSYRADAPHARPMETDARFVTFEGGLCEIGAPRVAGASPDDRESDASPFAFDNESPRHRRWLEPFALSTRLVSEREYAAFIAAGGYDDASLWLSDGWAAIKSRGWRAPLYWRRGENDEVGGFRVYDLRGERRIDPDAPVTCVSLYEADAYARWAGARLPTEEEWEVAAAEQSRADRGIGHLYDQAWQWTASAYSSYPGFTPFAGDFGEYNGKFMSSQVVLRGGSFTTTPGHTRLTYRNFFPPDARWQTSGIRLAK